jgi:hypothetical protein
MMALIGFAVFAIGFVSICVAAVNRQSALRELIRKRPELAGSSVREIPRHGQIDSRNETLWF